MKRRATTVAAWVIWGTGILLVLAGILLLFLNRSTWGNPVIMFTDSVVPVATALAYTSVGAFLFARFPRNSLTWVLSFIGLMYAFGLFVSEYSVHALVVDPGRLPAAPLLIWLLGPGSLAGGPFAIAMIVLLYPDGRPKSRGWAALLFFDIVLGAMTVVWSLVPQERFETQSLLRGVPLHFQWPDYLAVFQLRGSGIYKIIDFLARMAGVGLTVSAFVAVIGLVWRLWRARGAERQQLKWLTFTLAALMIGVAAFIFGGGVSYHSSFLTISGIGFLTLTAMLAFGIPTATLVAIMRYRLYDIDLIINKTLVYGLLGIVITAIYALVVVYIGATVGGPGRFGLSLLVTALIAIGFQPLRDRAQRVANRLVYGKRATPFEALSELNQHLAGAYGGEEVLHRMTRILAEATGAERAELWVKRGQELVRTSAWPIATSAAHAMRDGRLPEIAADKVLPVTHKGQLLGALALTKKRGESLTPLEEKLLADLAGQAGLVLENVGLNRELLARLEDLQASRQRLVTAQDEERRRIERNLHDGAQQHLVALKLKVGVAESLSPPDSRARPILAQLKRDADEAIDNLRELARGIYPPLLASDGLGAALRSHTSRFPILVQMKVDDVPRQPREVEAAIYFCCLEALQNVAKYAEASHLELRIWAENSTLVFRVHDDGRGFDPKNVVRSSGLQNMWDRLESLGGSLEVESAPGTGTMVEGRVPVALGITP